MASYNDIFYDDETPSWLTGKENDSQGSQHRNCVLGFSRFVDSCSEEYSASPFSRDTGVQHRAESRLISAAKSG
ncbi:hypothetical protein R1flu_011956 [Riccia fluitans]|uniref:Uncharacterized protein n=1 Tax=Riccia fluitans TaxID=41844 RepID=A0ABD1Z999_9MARC